MNDLWLRAKRVFESEPSQYTFEEALKVHLMLDHCYVFKTNAMIAFGRPVDKHASRQSIIDPFFSFARGDIDAWFIYLFVGKMIDLLRVVPYPLPHIIFERKNDLRYYETKALIDKL